YHLSFLRLPLPPLYFFLFNDPPTTDIYTLSLHDALPIFSNRRLPRPSTTGKVHTLYSSISAAARSVWTRLPLPMICRSSPANLRSEEHTSELQSLTNLVCRLLLEKKKTTNRSLPRSHITI